MEKLVTAPQTLDHYLVNEPPHPGPPRELSRQHAQANFDHYMAVESQRWQIMRELLQDEAITLAMPDTKVQELDDWYQSSVTIRPGSEHVQTLKGREHSSYRMDSVWYCIGEDLGLMLGDIASHRFPHLTWALCTFGGKKYVNRHQLVVVGY